jgi:hypothetical protein
VPAASDREYRRAGRAALNRKPRAGQSLKNTRRGVHGRALDVRAKETGDEVRLGVGSAQTVHVDIQLTVQQQRLSERGGHGIDDGCRVVHHRTKTHLRRMPEPAPVSARRA